MSEPPDPTACMKKVTCGQCRKRKVRCDGHYDGCRNCSRLGFECSLLSLRAIGPQSIQHPRPKRTRVSKACAACRAMKLRCSGRSPSCERCMNKGIDCIYSPGRGMDFESKAPGTRPFRQITPLDELADTRTLDSLSTPGSLSDPRTGSLFNQSSILLEPGRIKLAIDVFFKRLHCLPSLAFLHKASLMRLQSDNQADPALIAAIISVASLLPETPATEREIGSRCLELAERMIMNASRRPSISKVQALLLVTRYKVWTGSCDDAFMLMAQLTRSAFALQINHETTKPPYFVQESRRRLMWAIYMQDSMICCGIPEYTLCPIDAIHIRLPCPEDDFELNNKTNVEYIRPYGTSSERVGIIGHYIRIIHIHDEVIRYTKRAANPAADLARLVSGSRNLENELEMFASSLPDGERYSQKSLELRSFSPRLPRFVMTHVWWHQAYCQLFRATICNTSHILPESYIDILGPKVLREGQKKFVHHAQSICTIFASLLALEGDTWTLEYEMAESAYTTAKILLRIDIALQSEIGLTGEQVQGCAAVCLQLMKRLQQMYPYVSTLIADIELAIQNSQNVPFETAISRTIEISPYQYVPRYSIVGQTWSTNDDNVLGASTQSTASILPDSDSSLLRPDIDRMMCIDANSLLQKTRSPSSQYWVTDNHPHYPEFESISNIWGEMTFSDPHI